MSGRNAACEAYEFNVRMNTGSCERDFEKSPAIVMFRLHFHETCLQKYDFKTMPCKSIISDTVWQLAWRSHTLCCAVSIEGGTSMTLWEHLVIFWGHANCVSFLCAWHVNECDIIDQINNLLTFILNPLGKNNASRSTANPSCMPEMSWSIN